MPTDPKPPAPQDEPTQVMNTGAGDPGPTRVMPPAADAHASDATNVMPAGATPAPSPWPSSGSDTAPSTAGGTLPGGAPADAAEPQVRQVGRYEITERLGKGGMASVYRAHDPSIERDVAVKFLHASLSQDDEYRERFLREARAAGSLAHPNIVTVHDVGKIQGRPYMAMELLDGSTLADVLERDKMLPVRDAVLIGMQLARALDYAHARGIVHRDIKPGNIMLLRDGQTIKVTDFGIAHMDDGGRAQTQVGAVLGTPQYMSPEQTRGEKLDGRSDLFSAGIVLYQMLSGKRPFRGDSLVAVATRIATEDPPPLTAKRPEVPPTLRRVVERCLAKSPAQRYQSGRELDAALKKVLVELDEAALERDKRRIVPLRVKWAAMMAVLVAVVMGITAAVITQRQYAAIMDQVSDYGASLARFIATQNAAAVLGEEWETVDVAVQEMMKTRNFERVTVIDLGGIVRASSERTLVGKPYRSPATERLGTAGGTVASRYQVGDDPVLGFEAPVLFVDREVGRVALGIPEKPLTRVARLSILLMAVLALVTVVAVAVAMYFVANWFARPIRLVCESMDEVAKGRLDHRIREQRRDEFGELYAAFDRMAEALQKREAANVDTASEPMTTKTPTSVTTPAPPAPPVA